MATVMTSHQYQSNQPPLPARNNPGQSRVTHVKMERIPHQSNHSIHNASHDQAPPPLPSRESHPMRRKSFETESFVKRNTAKAFSDPDRLRSTSESSTNPASNVQGQGHSPTAHQSKTLPHRKTKIAGDTPPPPPNTQPPKRPPANYERLPLPPAQSPPHSQRHHGQQNQGPVGVAHATSAQILEKRQEPHTETPPRLPARPRKSSNASVVADTVHDDTPHRPLTKPKLNRDHSFDDFESRYRFHEPSDFPEPERTDVSSDKVYPSRSVSVKRKSKSNRDDGIGPL